MFHTIDSLHQHTIETQEATNAIAHEENGIKKENFFSARVVNKWNSHPEFSRIGAVS